MKKVSYTELDYQELENLIRKLPGKEKFEDIVCDNEWSNDTSHKFQGITGTDKYHVEQFKAWLKGDEKVAWAHMIMEGLCATGYIEPGDYLVTVSW